MGRIKTFVIYGIIIILCIAAIAGYILSKKQVNTSAAADTGIGTQSVVNETTAPAASTADAGPIVGIGRGEDYPKVTREAVENAGGLKDLIKQGDTVLIKPNMIKAAAPEQGIVTDYRMVQTLADMAKEYGAEKVIVADGSPWGKPFDDERTCYKKITGVELLDFNDLQKEDCYLLKAEKGLTGKEIYIPKIYVDADVVISAAKLKTHPEAVVTLSLKNAFGVPPIGLVGLGGSGKGLLHSLGIPYSIVDLNLIRKPDFVIIDGIIGGEGNMPISGTPVKSGTIFAGKDPVAVDTVGLNFMGFTVDDVPHVKLAASNGLGISDLEKIKIVGADLDSIKMKFKRAVSY